MIKPEYREGLRDGIAASFAAVLEQSLHPLDVVKTRFQSLEIEHFLYYIQNTKIIGHDGHNKNLVPKYKGFINALYEIGKTEGIRGLYRGVFYSLISNNISKFIFFGMQVRIFGSILSIFLSQNLKSYGMLRDQYSKYYELGSTKPAFYASIQSSFISTIITCPLWVIKTRILLNTSTNQTGLKILNEVIKEIYQQHGWLGYYRGLTLSLFLSIHGVIQLTVYEKIKYLMKQMIISNQFYQTLSTRSKNDGGLISALISSYSGMIGKIIAMFALFPISLIRTRIQQNQYIDGPIQKYQGSLHCIQKVIKEEGIKGFYKGFIPGTLRSLPSNAVFFFFYDFFRNNLPL